MVALRSVRALLAAGALTLAACQSDAQPTPAVLESADTATMEMLTSTLAEAMGVAHVELGPGDPTRTPTISAADYDRLVNFVGSIGYNVSDIERVPQRW